SVPARAAGLRADPRKPVRDLPGRRPLPVPERPAAIRARAHRLHRVHGPERRSRRATARAAQGRRLAIAGVDFQAEGLLERLDGAARSARLELLEQLHDSGFSLDELKQAVEEGRLPLLPVEQALGGEARYRPKELCAQTGLTLDCIAR